MNLHALLTYSSGVLLIALSSGALGCAPSLPPSLGGVRAQVLKMKDLKQGDSPAAAPMYELGLGTFEHLSDIKTASGPFYQMYQGGSFTLSSLAGSIAVTEGFTNGRSPGFFYDVKDGVIIPKDYETLVMLSNLYHFDTVFSALKELSGMDPDSLHPAHGKLEIFFEPTLQSTSIHVLPKLNAAFVPLNDQFLLFRRSGLEKLPLAANLQVIAHEFGHFVFDRTFFPLGGTSETERPSNFALSGLNEGFADFFSYTLTGSSNVLENSLGEDVIKPAERNFSVLSFTYEDLHKTESYFSPSSCGGSFYCIGSLFAKSLYNAEVKLGFILSSRADRSRFMRGIIQALTRARLDLAGDPSFQASLASEDTTLAAVFKAMLSHLSHSQADWQIPRFREALCEALRVQFNYGRVETALRDACKEDSRI